jgi:dTDP-4-amino-4,6-dideoxygalactose transaminase
MIPLVKPFIAPSDEMMPKLEKTLYSGYIAEGEQVYEFERMFGEHIANPNVLSLNSGTAALHIALLLCGVGPGDEVISTALTAEPTNVSIRLAGGKVVWADVDVATGLISPESIRAKITPKTKAILVVHYAGMVCDMDRINVIAKETGIPVIEDAAHALDSRYNGRPIGGNSAYTCFSLQAIKHMTTVDGGFLALKDKDQLSVGRKLRWFGLDKQIPRLQNDIRFPGYKYHMNNVNATIGLVQMRHLDRIVGRHKENGRYYDRTLQGIPGVTLLPYSPHTEPSYWLYTMKVERRNDFCRYLEDHQVAASPLHLRNDRHSVFAESKCELPGLDAFYNDFVHIPCGWWVGDPEREKVVELIRKGW